MSVPNTGIVSDPSVQSVGDVRPLPIDPNTDAVRVVTSSSSAAGVTPTSLIYTTVAAADVFSLIPAGATPASVTLVVARLIATSAPFWIQLHRGNGDPAANAIPLLVGDTITAGGGNTQFSFPSGGVTRATTGYVVTISSAQDTYVKPALARLIVRAYGQLP